MRILVVNPNTTASMTATIAAAARPADLARALQVEFGMPVVDGVGAAVKQAEALVSLGLTTAKRGAYAPPVAKAYKGMLKIFAPAPNPES